MDDIISKKRNEIDDLNRMQLSSETARMFRDAFVSDLNHEITKLEVTKKRNSKIKDIINTILCRILSYYSTHHYSKTTYDFFVENFAKVLNGDINMSEFASLNIPSPSDNEKTSNNIYDII